MINETLKNRILSFAWRASVMGTVAILGYIAANIGQFDLPVYVVTIVGLICGELTKWLNNEYQIGSKMLGRS